MQTLWKGAISFGLINVPVKMGAATYRENVHFRMLHKECNTPIVQKKYCPKCGRELTSDEIVSGYEYEPGKFVVLDEQELAGLPVKSARAIEIVDFIKLTEVDPIYYDRSYYLWPEKGGEKPYIILRDAMQQTGRVAVAKITIRQKEHLCVLRLAGDTLTLETMFFSDEVRPSAELGISGTAASVEVRPAEMEMAVKLVENLTSEFDPEKYTDEYRKELMKLIRAKVEGDKVVSAPEIEQPSNVLDLMEKLRQSVEATQKGAAKPRKKKTSA